ncbi:MAG: DNA (cytosine-5-)-methyltransferase [Candidatus Korobacteraceae bacterium]
MATIAFSSVKENNAFTIPPPDGQRINPHRLPLTFAEFFAGIGLVHLGLKPLGWECVYANDIDPRKEQMYKGFFGSADYYHVEDIWRTDAAAERIPAGTLLATASFPCVDLSLAGNRKGLAGEESGAFYGFVRTLQRLRRRDDLPPFVLIENVLGILTSHSGKDFAEAVACLAALGYALDTFVIDAKHFVPQSRPRLFVIGCLTDALPSHVTTEQKWTEQECATRPHAVQVAAQNVRLKTGWINLPLPPLPPTQRTLSDIIDIGGDQEWWEREKIDKHLAEMHQSHRERIEKLTRSTFASVGTIYRRVREGRSRSEIRTDGLAGCLRTPRGGSSRQIVFAAGRGRLRMRWMSPREYARLQGAADFPINVERNQALFGFGDAVCVPVISWIAEHALSQLIPAEFNVPVIA